MKKLITLGVLLIIVIATLAACSEAEPVTLENMKTALSDAGYKEIGNLESLPENAVNGFTFIYPGAHGDTDIPVLEFKDKASADNYAEYINTDEDHLAVVSDKFLTIAEAHHGVAHASEKTFLENLINGRSVK
jgi:hypothetical protein